MNDRTVADATPARQEQAGKCRYCASEVLWAYTPARAPIALNPAALDYAEAVAAAEGLPRKPELWLPWRGLVRLASTVKRPSGRVYFRHLCEGFLNPEPPTVGDLLEGREVRKRPSRSRRPVPGEVAQARSESAQSLSALIATAQARAVAAEFEREQVEREQVREQARERAEAREDV